MLLGSKLSVTAFVNSHRDYGAVQEAGDCRNFLFQSGNKKTQSMKINYTTNGVHRAI